MRPGDKIIPFGPYCFKTFDQIADTDNGVLYLDALMDNKTLSDEFKDNLKTFLDQPHIQTKINELIE